MVKFNSVINKCFQILLPGPFFLRLKNLKQFNSSTSRLQITQVFLAIKLNGFSFIQNFISRAFHNNAIIFLASEFPIIFVAGLRIVLLLIIFAIVA